VPSDYAGSEDSKTAPLASKDQVEAENETVKDRVQYKSLKFEITNKIWIF
jgi:hypothetical protein